MNNTKTDAAFSKENTLANDVAGIVARMQAGEDAFAELYEKTKRYVYYVAVSNNVPQSDVDDVVQETFVHFYKKYNEILNPQSALAWLKRSAFGHSVDHLKKRPGELLMEEDSSQGLMDTDALVAPFEVPEDIVEREDLARILGGIIDGLPDDQRKCIRAFYFNELKVKDIAATYDVPESTVKTHLFRGRKTIESELNAISRKHGVKFVAFAAVPFLSLAFTEKASACAVGLTFTSVAQAAGVAAGSTFGATVGASGSTIGAAGATSSIAGGTAGVAGTTAGVGTGAAAGSAAATAVGSAIVKGIAIKAAIAVVSVGVISGGTVAAHSYYVDNVLPAIQAESRVAAQPEEYPENNPENAPENNPDQTAVSDAIMQNSASLTPSQTDEALSTAQSTEIVSGYFKPISIEGVRNEVDLNNDGKPEYLTVNSVRENKDAFQFGEVRVEYNGHKANMDGFWIHEYTAKLVHLDDNRNYVYVLGRGANADAPIIVFELRENEVKYKGSWGGYETEEKMVDPAGFYLSRPGCPLNQAIFINRLYSVGEDGLPVAKKGFVDISFDRPLVVKKSFTASGVDINTNELKGSVQLKKGDKLYFYRTNIEDTVICTKDDGSYVGIKVRDYNMIGNTPSEELFEDVFTAG